MQSSVFSAKPTQNPYGYFKNMNALVHVKSEVILQPVRGLPQLCGAIHHLLHKRTSKVEKCNLIDIGAKATLASQVSWDAKNC